MFRVCAGRSATAFRQGPGRRRAGVDARSRPAPVAPRGAGDRASVTPIAYLHPHYSVKAKLTVSAKHTPAGPGKRAFVRSGAGGFASH